MIRAAALFISAGFLFTAKTAVALDYAPKLSLRTGAGLLKNEGANRGSSATTGGINLLFTYFLTSRLTTGVGFKADFDLAHGSIPLRGFDLSGRYYFWGEGTRVLHSTRFFSHEMQDRASFYFGGDFSQRSYFFPGATAESDDLSGSFGAANATLGSDIPLSRHFEWNIEVVYSILTFAATDSQVKIKSTLLQTGLNYVW